jgi:hypothetical protein
MSKSEETGKENPNPFTVRDVSDAAKASERKILPQPNNRMEGEALEGIRRDFERLSDSFSCSGSMKWQQLSFLPRPIDIYYETKEVGRNELRNLRLPVPASDLQELVRACDAASIGIDGMDVAESSEHGKVYQLDAAKFACSFDLGLTEILHTVHKALKIEAEYVTAKMFRLDIHQEGGFTKAQKNGAPEDGILGTLVCCLPQGFTGGDTVIKHKDSILHRYTPLDGIKQENRIQWIAFSSGCEVEIEKVTSGSRISLTYTLHRGEADAAPEHDESGCAIDLDLYKSTFELISGRKFEGILGFPFEHVYVSGSSIFKGRDLVVWNTLTLLAKERGDLDVEKRMVTKIDELAWCNEDHSDDSDCAECDGTEVYRYIYIAWDRFKDGSGCFYTEGGCDDEKTYVDEFFEKNYGGEELPVTWVIEPKDYGYEDTVAAWGNEVYTHHIYSAGCLLVYIGASD